MLWGAAPDSGPSPPAPVPAFSKGSVLAYSCSTDSPSGLLQL